MDPKRVALVLLGLAMLCFVVGVATNFFWYRVSFSDDIHAPDFLSVFWDFDGPYDDNTYCAGVFNVICFLLLSVAAVLYWGRAEGKD